MKRRAFFKGLLGSAAAAPLVAQATAQRYEGWTLHWNGWRQHPGSDWIYGFWTAVHPDGPRLYSTTGGICDAYTLGGVFNLSVREGHPFLTGEASAGEQATEQRRAKEHLIGTIREVEAGYRTL